MIPNKIIVSSDNEDVHRLCVVRIVYFKGMEESLQCGPGYGNVINMQGVALVLSAGGGWWCKEIMECGV